MRSARLGFALLSTAWIVLLVTAPAVMLGAPASALTYAFGSLICHQQPERSFHVAAAQLPVCARCLGLYAGAAIGAVLLLLPGPLAGSASTSSLRRLVSIAAVPTLVTWLAEVAGAWSPGNAVRFAAALPLGAVVALTVNYLGCAPLPRTGHRPPRRAI